MRRSAIPRGKPLERKTGLSNRSALGVGSGGRSSKSSLKRSQPKRNWQEAREKVEREGCCRLYRDGGCSGKLEAAHVIGREHDEPRPCKRCNGSGTDPRLAYADADGVDNIEAPCAFCGYGGAEYIDGKAHVLIVKPARVVPLCSAHHAAYDRHEIDLLAALEMHEQVQAVADTGSIELARMRTCPGQYRREGR